MKKKLALIAIEKAAMEKYLQNLREVFGNKMDLEGYFVKNKELPERIEGDLVLLTSVDLTSTVRSHIRENMNIIYLERTLNKDGLDCLFEVPADRKMLFVDYTEQTANKMISLITEYGIRNIDFYAVGKDTLPEVVKEKIDEGYDTVVTPGLTSLVPREAKKTIDIGWANIDSKTLLEISVMLDLYNEEFEEQLYLYTRNTITSSKSVMFYLKSALEAKSKYNTVISTMEEGVVVFDTIGHITRHNHRFIKMFGMQPTNLTGENIKEIKLPETLKKKIISHEPIEETMLYVPEQKKSYIITKKDVKIFGEVAEFIVIINEIFRYHKKNAQIRAQMRENGYFAKYKFDDIIGNSELLHRIKERARKIAQIDATVLITGESGTGKEMFAQAIHNESQRKDMPFVAINCATLTPSLLESELFGYEAGAFTDSKSEGHIGLFETAHKGTIFLDEIGEVPINVQTKLLRVLEEKEIRRVGGRAIIPIDVRIIAATNQDLYELCKQKRFREDLYYRLSVLPLQMVPLRNRKEDIPNLIAHILKNIGMTQKRFTEDLMEALMNHSWKGNVRELSNCIQYMAYLGGDLLDVSLLPPNFDNVSGPTGESQCEDIVENDVFYYDEEKRISALILESLQNTRKGRLQILKSLRSQGVEVSEYKVRKIVAMLKECGYVSYSKGRGGISLTEKGHKTLKMGKNESLYGRNKMIK